MTVSELIELLSGYPGDARVLISALKAIDMSIADTVGYYERRNEVVISDY